MTATDGLQDSQAYYFHVRILLGMVVGLALTHLLRGIARTIECPQKKTLHWVHGAWVLWMFIYLLHFWWWQLQLSLNQVWTFSLMAFLVIYSLLLYLIAALLFPEDMAEYPGYREYIQSRGPWFFGLLATVFVVDFYDTWIKGADYFYSLGLEYPLRNVAYVALCIIAMRTRSRWFHGAFVLVALGYEISWIARLWA
jgi:hypothetical protein